MPDKQPNPRHVLCDLIHVVENCDGPGGKPGPCPKFKVGDHVAIPAGTLYKRSTAEAGPGGKMMVPHPHAGKSGEVVKVNQIGNKFAYKVKLHHTDIHTVSQEKELVPHTGPITGNCGGPGGKPGPCPEGHGDFEKGPGAWDVGTEHIPIPSLIRIGRTFSVIAGQHKGRHGTVHDVADGQVHGTVFADHKGTQQDVKFHPNDIRFHPMVGKWGTSNPPSKHWGKQGFSINTTESVENCGGPGGKPGPCEHGGGGHPKSPYPGISDAEHALHEKVLAAHDKYATDSLMDHHAAQAGNAVTSIRHNERARQNVQGLPGYEKSGARFDAENAQHRATIDKFTKLAGITHNAKPLTREAPVMGMPGMNPTAGDGAAAEAMSDKAGKSNLPADHKAAADKHKSAAAFHLGQAGDHDTAAGGDAMSSNARQEAVEFLIVNSCGCWGEEDRNLLGSMDESRLSALRANAEQHQRDTVILNALRGEGLVVNGVLVRVDSDDTIAGEYVANDNSRPDFKSLLRDYGTDQEKEVWNAAVQVHAAERQILIDKLVANSNVSQRQAAAEVYGDMPMPKLRSLVAALPPKPTQRSQPVARPVVKAPNYGAAGVGPGATAVNNQSVTPAVDKRDEPLGLPRMSFANPLKQSN